MSNRVARTGQLFTGTAATAIVICACATLAGCKKPADANTPVVAEVQIKPPEVSVKPGEVEVGSSQIKLEDALPLTPDKVGKMILVRGQEVGKTTPTGFFIKTDEGNHVLFVRTTMPVQPGDKVSAVGPLAIGEVAVQRSLQADALNGVAVTGWDIIPTYVIDATAVTKVQ